MGNKGPKMSEVDLDDLNMVFLTEKRQFIFSGVYPLPTYTILYYVRTIILFFFSSVLALSMISALAVGVNDISQTTDILYYLMTQSVYLWKLIALIIGKSKILAIEDHLRQPVFYKYLTKYGADFLKEGVFYVSLLVSMFRVSILIIVISYGVFPLVDNDPEKNVPFAGWFPVDKNKYRAPIYALQLTCVFVSGATNSSIDIITAKMIIIAVAMLKTLKRCLRETDYTDGARSDIVSSDLRDIVILHEHILQYLTMIEDLFSYGVFVQFVGSIAVICLTGFQMLVVPVRSAQFILLVSFIVGLMFQVALYCWYGNKILSESDGITTACYMSNWYEGTPKAKKVLFVIMERSKREVKLTAGKMFTLSLATLILIFKSSYSYFVVLQRVYKEA